ncbi:WD40 repeat-like protein [Hesseltinella vesiculosa]|uniref:WD40 repeat-like protein n=1 Tax=Hesseltinella vesiculosa TaxID=101127 RepID=A0A1X2GWH4_9FUNG|nr:WD40 repeat-like protein [Hesseltinella vesiculosa]
MSSAEINEWLWKRRLYPACSNPTQCLRYPRRIVQELYGQPYFLNRMKQWQELKGHNGCVNTLFWSEKGDKLLTGSDDNTLRIWYPFDNAIKKEHIISTGHSSNIFTAKFMPNTNDQVIVSGAGDAEVRVFDLSYSGDIPEHIYVCHSHPVKHVAPIGSSPHEFLTCSEDSTVRHFDLRQPHRCPPHYMQSFNSSRRRMTPLYTSQHFRVSPRPLSEGCPGPLLDYSPFDLDINCMSLNQLRPYYFAVAGMHDFMYLLDRRMMPVSTTHGPHRATPPCVRRFQPDRGNDSTRGISRYITACKFSDANGDELLGSWAGEAVYLFDITATAETMTPANFQTTINIRTAPLDVPFLDEDRQKSEPLPWPTSSTNSPVTSPPYTTTWKSAYAQCPTATPERRRREIIDALEQGRFVDAIAALNDYYLSLQTSRNNIHHCIAHDDSQLHHHDHPPSPESSSDGPSSDASSANGAADARPSPPKKHSLKRFMQRAIQRQTTRLRHTWIRCMLAIVFFYRAKHTADRLAARCERLKLQTLSPPDSNSSSSNSSSSDANDIDSDSQHAAACEQLRDDLLAVKVELTRALEYAPNNWKGAWVIMVTYWLLCGENDAMQLYWHQYKAHGYAMPKYAEHPLGDRQYSHLVPRLSQAEAFCEKSDFLWDVHKKSFPPPPIGRPMIPVDLQRPCKELVQHLSDCAQAAAFTRNDAIIPSQPPGFLSTSQWLRCLCNTDAQVYFSVDPPQVSSCWSGDGAATLDFFNRCFPSTSTRLNVASLTSSVSTSPNATQHNDDAHAVAAHPLPSAQSTDASRSGSRSPSLDSSLSELDDASANDQAESDSDTPMLDRDQATDSYQDDSSDLLMTTDQDDTDSDQSGDSSSHSDHHRTSDSPSMSGLYGSSSSLSADLGQNSLYDHTSSDDNGSSPAELRQSESDAQSPANVAQSSGCSDEGASENGDGPLLSDLDQSEDTEPQPDDTHSDSQESSESGNSDDVDAAHTFAEDAEAHESASHEEDSSSSGEADFQFVGDWLNSDDEPMDVGDDDSDDHGYTFDIQDSEEFGYQQLNCRQRSIRTAFETDVPILRPQKRYIGHLNAKTIKDVNYFGANDEYVVSGSDDGRAYVWDKATGKLMQLLKGDQDTVNNIVGHPTLPIMAISGIDDSVKLFAPIAKNAYEGSCMADSDEIVLRNVQQNNRTRGTNIYSISALDWMATILRAANFNLDDSDSPEH